MSKTKPSSALQANLVLQGDNQPSVSEAQMRLLQAIDSHGSISAAARALGISYKTAWDRIDSMNNLSRRALVTRSAGGSRGGGTRLTEAGRELLTGFAALKQEHDAFVARLGSRVKDVGDVANYLRGAHLQTSARNQYQGIVTRLSRGGVNTEVEVALSDNTQLVAVVTNDSRRNLKLKKGSPVIALVKASWVLLSRDPDIRTSARNQLTGSVSKISRGEVNSEVILDLGDGKTLCAVITNASAKSLGLKKGMTACALFKASSVILMQF
ncbi:MAG: TOBE domain-containing protein [Pseudohongiellaceae bacterium]